MVCSDLTWVLGIARLPDGPTRGPIFREHGPQGHHQGCGIKELVSPTTSVIQNNPPLYEEHSLWEALPVVSRKWKFPTALVLRVTMYQRLTMARLLALAEGRAKISASCTAQRKRRLWRLHVGPVFINQFIHIGCPATFGWNQRCFWAWCLEAGHFWRGQPLFKKKMGEQQKVLLFFPMGPSFISPPPTPAPPLGRWDLVGPEVDGDLTCALPRRFWAPASSHVAAAHSKNGGVLPKRATPRAFLEP